MYACPWHTCARLRTCSYVKTQALSHTRKGRGCFFLLFLCFIHSFCWSIVSNGMSMILYELGSVWSFVSGSELCPLGYLVCRVEVLVSSSAVTWPPASLQAAIVTGADTRTRLGQHMWRYRPRTSAATLIVLVSYGHAILHSVSVSWTSDQNNSVAYGFGCIYHSTSPAHYGNDYAHEIFLVTLMA